MTDLSIYPDDFLSAPIDKEQELENGWTICLLEDGQFVYFDTAGYFHEIKEEDFKWNLFWRARMENQGARSTVPFVDLVKQQEKNQLIDNMLLFLRTHRKQVE